MRIFYDEIFETSPLKNQFRDFFLQKDTPNSSEECLIVQTKKSEFVVLGDLDKQEPKERFVFKDIPCKDIIADFKQFSPKEIFFLGLNSTLSFFEYDIEEQKQSLIDKIVVREGSKVQNLDFTNQSDKVFIGLFDFTGSFFVEILKIGKESLMKVLNFKIPISPISGLKVGFQMADESLLSIFGVYSESKVTEIRSFKIEGNKVFECNRVNFKAVLDYVRFFENTLWILDDGCVVKLYHF